MKKFLVILMVIAMASVLFVGCTTPPTPEPEPEPTPTPTPTVQTDTPIITLIDGGNCVLSSTATQYIGALTVTAVAPIGSVVKLYVNDVWVGTGVAAAGIAGPIAAIGTIADGVKTIYVTATLSGFAVSEKSTIYTATLDTVAPNIASVVADSSAQTITVTFNKAVNTGTVAAEVLLTARNLLNYKLDGNVLTVASVATKISSTVISINVLADPLVFVSNDGDVFVLACKDIEDTLGNAMADTFTTTYVGVVVP